MAKIVGMNIKNRNKVNTVVEQMVLKVGMGIIGDNHASNSMREISLLRTEAVRAITSHYRNGLCTKRFIPNIIVDGLCLADIVQGAQFKIGDTVIEICEVGKTCFDNCNLLKNNNRCSLSNEAVFAKVIKGGTITIGEEIRKI